MDPDKALADMRSAIQRFHVAVLEGDHEDDQLGEAHQVVEAAEALDEWLSRKGFLPRAWAGRTDPPRMVEVDPLEAERLMRDDDYTPEAVNRTNG